MRAVLVLVLTAASAFANTPPNPPVIIEPADAAHPIDPGDVHMATAPFADPDPGDTHSCSDWEIRSPAGQPVWYAYCATGVLAIHIHLGDGRFVNGERHLAGNSQYELRVRFRDSSGDPDTEWSDWTSRPFATGPSSSVYPMEVLDVLDSPPPRLHDANGAPLTLLPSASIALVSEEGEILIAIDSQRIVNPPALHTHTRVKALVSSGEQPLFIPASNIDFTDDGGMPHTVYLPAITLAAGTFVQFWIAQDGSSFNEATFTNLARAAETPWRVFDSGYVVERVASGLQLPVNIAFVPNPAPDQDAPLFYITELYGTIRVILRNRTMGTYAAGLLNFDPTGVFPGSGEHGTAGTAVDPETGDLFVATVYAANDGEHDPKVIRIHSNDDGRTAATISTVLEMPGEEIGPSHQISSVSFGADGKLYVHVGDGFRTELAINLQSFRGKILRLNRDGTAPPDNPFYDSADGITATDYIFAYGFRNPFGGAWRAADQSLYSVDNGPSVDRLSKIGAGMNFQWNGSDDNMRVNAAYNWEPSVAPVNIAFVQESTFGGSGFLADKFDHAFVTESGPTWVAGVTELGKRIREFAFDPAGRVTSTHPFLEYTGTGYATVAALAAGPDGLYFSDLFPDQGTPIEHEAHVYRIRRAGRVSIAAAVTNDATHTVQFVGNVNVPGASTVYWDFGDGTTSSEPNPEHTFAGKGPYDVKLSVIGSDSVVVDDTKRVQFPDLPGSGLVAIYTDTLGNHVSRVDPQIDFDWQFDAPPLPSEMLDVTWTGAIVPSVSGRYTFEVQTDGDASLLIDGRLVIDKQGRNPSIAEPIVLEAGHRYALTLTCENTPMAGFTQLLWSPDGLQPRIVPTAVFYTLTGRRRSSGH
jgi:glucose/arabinose dehydrogenase